MEQLVLAWYGWLSSLTQGIVLRLEGWGDRFELPLLTVVIFGLIGATSPCQLTTNLGALAYVSARSTTAPPMGLALAYVLGKVSVYATVGGLVVLAGLQLQSASIPVVIVARKALGPLMILVGLALLGMLRFGVLGQRAALSLRQRLVGGDGPGAAFLLGVAFSFAFCPTLFWLFFGLTVPLALRSAGGWAFPGVFAVASSLPLLAAVGAVGLGLGTVGRITGGIRRVERGLRVSAGVILILAGLHDTLIYWVL